MAGTVVAVEKDAAHRFSKVLVPEILVVEGLGVEGDAHQGTTVKHRSRVAVDPRQPNLRQVHLVHFRVLRRDCREGLPRSAGGLGREHNNVRYRSARPARLRSRGASGDIPALRAG